MLAIEDDIIVCYKAGLKKTNIIKHYGISKMRLNRILEGIEAPKNPHLTTIALKIIRAENK